MTKNETLEYNYVFENSDEQVNKLLNKTISETKKFSNFKYRIEAKLNYYYRIYRYAITNILFCKVLNNILKYLIVYPILILTFFIWGFFKGTGPIKNQNYKTLAGEFFAMFPTISNTQIYSIFKNKMEANLKHNFIYNVIYNFLLLYYDILIWLVFLPLCWIFVIVFTPVVMIGYVILDQLKII